MTDKRRYSICIFIKSDARHYIAVDLKQIKQNTDYRRHFLLKGNFAKIGQHVVEIILAKHLFQYINVDTDRNGHPSNFQNKKWNNQCKQRRQERKDRAG